MKEKPILFSTPMVQAILEGRKTQTRRIVKFGSKHIQNPEFGFTTFSPDGSISVRGYHMPGGEYGESFIKMPCQVGDILWVRESFAVDHECIQGSHGYSEGEPTLWPPFFRAKNGLRKCVDFKADRPGSHHKWKPSIHMPKTACRIWLKVTDVRVEKLQNISDEDSEKEGVTPMVGTSYLYRRAFFELWMDINGVKSYRKNPCVWVISFEVLSTNGKPVIS